jgi:hypothetical protein
MGLHGGNDCIDLLIDVAQAIGCGRQLSHPPREAIALLLPSPLVLLNLGHHLSERLHRHAVQG